jgi:hypothetical protein
VLLSAAFGAFLARRWDTRSGIVLTLVAFSHWLLDLVVHRPDLPILPGDVGYLPRLGFGLWRTEVAAAVVEVAIVVVGSLLYWRAARDATRTSSDSAQRRARTLGVAVLGAGLLTLLIDTLVG